MATVFTDQITGGGETLAMKAPVRLATTGNITLSGHQTIDGVLTNDDEPRTLVWQQTDPKQNGIYIAQSGIWQRARDFDGNRDVTKGTRLTIVAGSTLAGKEYQITTATPIVIGTSNITFAETLSSDAGSSAAAAAVSAENAATSEGNAEDFAIAAAASVAALLYVFSTATADADPGAGVFRLNNSDPALATSAYLDNVDGDGLAVGSLIDEWDDSTNTVRGTLTIRSKTVPATRRVYDVSGTVIDGTGYRKVTLSYVGGAGTITNTMPCLLIFNPNGDKGADGDMTFANAVLDEDDMASNSATKVPTQQSVKAYVDGVRFWVTPDMFGAVGNGTTIDNTAVQAAATFAAANNVPLVIPGKTYRLTTPIAVTAPITIRGAGMSASRLVWDSGNGISVTASVARATIIEDVSFETKAVAAGDALTIDYSALISGGVIVPRAETHSKLHRVRIRGATGYTVDGWLNGVVGVSLLGLDVDSCRINGVYTGAYGSMPNSAKGIYFYGSGSPIQLTVSRSAISAWQDAVYTADAEGIYLHNNEFVTVGRGYQCVNAVTESGIFVTDNHIATVDTAIVMGNMADGFIKNNLIYNVADVTPLKGIHIKTGCKNLEIGGNIVRRLGTVSLMLGIHLEAGNDILISPNLFDLGTSQIPIQIDSGFTRATVRKQHYISAPSAAQITNTSTTSMFEEFDGFTGDLDSIVLDSYRMTRQLHTLGAGVTNVPAAFTSTAGAVVETFSLDANTAYQRAFQPNTQATFYVRRRVSGTWATWAVENQTMPVTKTGDFTVSTVENDLIVNKGSTCTATLPNAALYPTREIRIKTIQAFSVVSASSNVVPLAGGAAGTAILDPIAGKWAVLVSDGTNWVTQEGGATSTNLVLTTPTITTRIEPTTDDGAPLGSTTKNWSDLFLASGAVINYANSNYLITHTTGTLTFGGNVQITGVTLLVGSFVVGSGAVTKNADFTLAATESSIIITKGSSCVVTLPVVNAGRRVRIKTTVAFTTVSIAANVIPRAGGAAGTAILPATPGAWVELEYNAAGWEIMASS